MLLIILYHVYYFLFSYYNSKMLKLNFYYITKESISFLCVLSIKTIIFYKNFLNNLKKTNSKKL